MNESLKKIKKLRKKLYLLQKNIMEIAYKNDITDYFLDKKLTAKYHEATLLEIVLEAWIDKYNEEIKMFWDCKDLNDLHISIYLC